MIKGTYLLTAGLEAADLVEEVARGVDDLGESWSTEDGSLCLGRGW